MATPKLWRASDNYLISDVPSDWDTWGETSGVNENELLIGSLYHMEQLGDEFQTGTVTFKFADAYPNSTLHNLNILKRCRRLVQDVIFQDFQGNLYTCVISMDIGQSRIPNRLVEKIYGSVTLRRAGSEL